MSDFLAVGDDKSLPKQEKRVILEIWRGLLPAARRHRSQFLYWEDSLMSDFDAVVAVIQIAIAVIDLIMKAVALFGRKKEDG